MNKQAKNKNKTKKSHHSEACFGLADCGAASQHAEEKQDCADAEDDGGRDQRVLVLDEALEVIVAVDHVGSHVGQRASCSLGGSETLATVAQGGTRGNLTVCIYGQKNWAQVSSFLRL